MQTILGANGIIGEELAIALRSHYTADLTLVGRNPSPVHPDDKLRKADLYELSQVLEAVKGSDIVYLTAGLPYDSKVWIDGWFKIMKNVIEACMLHRCKLVYFDNTYAYPQDVAVQREDTPYKPSGKKGQGKKKAIDLLHTEMKKGNIEALVARAPEFYGPGKTKSISNALIFDNIKNGKAAQCFLRKDTVRTLIYTPDASKATALLGNSPDTYNQVWHLPCDDNRLTVAQFVSEISNQLNKDIPLKILNRWILKGVALFNKNVKETQELLPRYEIDNVFESSKFKKRFPNFKVTTYAEGIASILKEMI